MAVQVEGKARRGRPSRISHRREEVLRMAARVFSQYGYRHATLEDVALELGVTRPALYHYARSKDELLSECAKLAFAALREAAASARAAGPGLEQLRAFFRRYAEIICDDFGRCFVLTDLREMGEPEKESARQAQVEFSVAVQGMVASGVTDGSIRVCEPADISRALFGAFNGIPRWYHAESRRTPTQVADSILDFFFRGIASDPSPV